MSASRGGGAGRCLRLVKGDSQDERPELAEEDVLGYVADVLAEAINHPALTVRWRVAFRSAWEWIENDLSDPARGPVDAAESPPAG